MQSGFRSKMFPHAPIDIATLYCYWIDILVKGKLMISGEHALEQRGSGTKTPLLRKWGVAPPAHL